MMKTYDLYGYSGASKIEVVKRLIEDLLSLKFEEHESSFHCGRYFRKGHDGSEHLILQYNYDNVEEEWAEMEFSKFTLILYLNETFRSADIESKLFVSEEFKLLRRDQL